MPEKSVRIGITGVLMGKSTFIESFENLRFSRQKVAVLAMTQVLRVNKGSILGDKTEWKNWQRRKRIYSPSPEFWISRRSCQYYF